VTERKPWRARVVDKTPVTMLTHAYEVLVATALVIMGTGLVLDLVNQSSVHRQVPGWMAEAWGWSLFLGSGLTLWGLFGMKPRTEWAGQMLTGWATFFYSLALATGVPLREGGVATAIFLAIALTAWWRAFKITSAAYIQHRLTLAAREAHVRARVHRNGRAGSE